MWGLLFSPTKIDVCSDPGNQDRDRRQQRNSLCQGCPTALVPDEDSRVSSVNYTRGVHEKISVSSV